jgi:hypothetical protein
MLSAFGGTIGRAQEAPPPATAAERPLPDISALIQEVDKRQIADEAVEKDYLYRETRRTEQLDGKGRVKKVEVLEFDIFSVNGVRVSRLMKKEGKDLAPEELKKENERIDKEVAKAKERRAKAEDRGEETDSEGHREIAASRILELGRFTNERRVTLDGRDTIAVDFTGDPSAKTHDRGESFLRDAAGTVWIDERDRLIAQLQAHVVNDFKVGGGLVADLRKGSSISLRTRKINDEVWLPLSFEAHGKVRVLLFAGFDGNVEVSFGGYRKFKATSTILPAVEAQPEDPPKP